MAPLKKKDTNKVDKKSAAPKRIDPTPINKENYSAATKSKKSTSEPKSTPINPPAVVEIESSKSPTPPPSTTTPTASKPNLNDEISDLEDGEPILLKWNCNQVRTRINTYLNNTSTTLKDFHAKLRIGANSFRTFMAQSGPNAGSGSDTYIAAHHFFSKREAAGLSQPRAPAKKTASATTTSKKVNEDDKLDVSSITLDGEEAGTVPVFDTCNDIRTKMSAHLRKHPITQASFARSLSACLGPDDTPIQGKLITDFRSKGKTGPMSGNTSKVFYSAYVYFEKLRLKEGKKKSKKREEMEGEYGVQGVDRTTIAGNQRLWLHNSETAHVSNTGKLIVGRK